jgi:3-hydroxyisobutyrate dehydrogenase-like beta-hydroxyacid dehydrogenase
MATKVGVIGLGAMGAASARRLAEKGFEVIAFDVRPELARELNICAPAASVAELSATSDVILAFVPYSHQVEAVATGEDGVLDNAQPGTVFVNMSTTSPTTTRQVAARLAERGIEMIGAPMNGGPEKAVVGELALVVGGADATVEKCRPVLEALGEMRHVGEVGAGEVAKIINNLLLAIATVANAEALVLGVKAGLDPDKLVDAVANGVGSNHSMRKQYQQHVLKGDFAEEGLFSVDFMRKDLALAFELANELQVPLTFGSMADLMYQTVRAKGRARNYHPVVVTLLEELAGVEVRSRA